MKVAEVTQALGTEGGGVASSVLDMARNMTRTGLEVHLFSAATASARETTADFSTNAHLNEFRGPISFGFQPALRRDLAALDPDVVHIHGLWGFPSYLLAKRRKQIAKVISPHGMLDEWARNNARWKKEIASVLFERKNIASASCIRALCEAERVAIQAYVPGVPIALIPNGVNLPAENAPSDTASWRSSLPANAKVLLFLGRIHRKKGLARLLAALNYLHQHDAMDEWHLVIAGWDEDGESMTLRKTVTCSGLSDRVHFVGPQFGYDRDLSYRAADIFILPSFSEGLPMAVLEAWSFSLPVVMTSACNIPEGFSSGSAIEIETEPGSMARTLRSVFQMEMETVREIGRRGRILVENRFSWARVSDDMARLYAWTSNPGTKRPDFVDPGPTL